MNSSAAQMSLQDVQSAVNRVPQVDVAPDTSQVTGIHLGHNAAAALVEDGKLLFAMQEERLSRVKNQGGLPVLTLDYITGLANARQGANVSREVALGGRNLSLCYWRRDDILRTAGSAAPNIVGRAKNLARSNAAISDWINQRKWSGIAENLEPVMGGAEVPVHGIDHHLSHAASAYFGWGKMDEDVLVLTCDGAGDRLCATINIARSGKIRRVAGVDESHSIGALYGKITYLSGMVPMEHEYKLMGLAPYAEKARESQSISEDFEALFAFDRDNPMLWTRTADCPPLQYSAEFLSNLLRRKRFDHIAGGVQLFVERFLVRWVQNCIAETGVRKVALSGGVFMNVKANQKILNLPEVEELFVFPSCGDETNSIGAAWLLDQQLSKKAPEKLGPFYLGPEYSDAEIETALRGHKFKSTVETKISQEVERNVAELLAKGSVVARFKGRMEFGARALGNRSILANPAVPGVVKIINEMIKCRDFWMPFAPSVLAERSEKYFYKPKPVEAPYMILTLDSRPEKRDAMAAAIHPYDATGRPQEVYESWNPDYHRLISHFEQLTGEAIILNTSFNLHGEPVVCSPEDALRVFDISGLEHLAIGNFLLSKK
jgi:carbamoyltransferase